MWFVCWARRWELLLDTDKPHVRLHVHVDGLSCVDGYLDIIVHAYS